MALDSNVAFVNTNGAAFPNNEGVNASGPTAVDGTEFVKIMIDNYMFGPQQALLNHAGLIPDGIPEADGTSQEVDAMKKSFGYPGESVDWYGDLDPAVVGAKILLLHGQGVLIASYPELTTSVYVGDGNNPTAPAFYKADDAAGTIRNVGGVYLILPDARDIHPIFKREPTYSARIDATGLKVSENDGFISSVTRVSAGRYVVNFTPSFFTTIPVCVMSPDNNDTDTTGHCYNSSLASVEILTQNQSGTPFDRAFGLIVNRQSPDADPFGSNFVEPGIRY